MSVTSKLIAIICMWLLTLVVGLFGPRALKRIHYNYVNTKIVKLLSPEGGGGTGFLIRAPSGETYVLSNDHVCDGAVEGIMYTNAGYDLEVVKVDERFDLCLLKGKDLWGGMHLGDDPDIGDEVAIAGHPYLNPLTETFGEVYSFMLIELRVPEDSCEDLNERRVKIMTFFGPMETCLRKMTAYYTSAKIYPGNSGSPVFNMWNRVVGIVFAGQNSTHYGYFTPASAIEQFISGF